MTEPTFTYAKEEMKKTEQAITGEAKAHQWEHKHPTEPNMGTPRGVQSARAYEMGREDVKLRLESLNAGLQEGIGGASQRLYVAGGGPEVGLQRERIFTRAEVLAAARAYKATWRLDGLSERARGVEQALSDLIGIFERME